MLHAWLLQDCSLASKRSRTFSRRRFRAIARCEGTGTLPVMRGLCRYLRISIALSRHREKVRTSPWTVQPVSVLLRGCNNHVCNMPITHFTNHHVNCVFVNIRLYRCDEITVKSICISGSICGHGDQGGLRTPLSARRKSVR